MLTRKPKLNGKAVVYRDKELQSIKGETEIPLSFAQL